ncbi:uncharacterized protein LOC134686108 [Mytilus trossulus]|uniref:uncharacterized protein LOC134686108 n=1 Tax=Mytilus trossulus TaxID=6551 RepID=UPI0030056B25
MNETDTTLKDDEVGTTVTVLFTSLAAASVLIDIAYIIVCFKALKKTFHHLTILMLFFSDITLGISSTMFSLGTVLKHEHVESCLLQIFIVTFGLQSNYCLIFLLCFQRYLVVRSYNFGIVNTFDKNKYIYIGGSLCLVLVISFCGTILPPHDEFMHICRPPVVYGDSFYIFIIVNLLPITLIIFLLFIMSAITSLLIWKLYFKGTIAPMDVVKEEKNITCHVQASTSTTGQSAAGSPKHVSFDIEYNQNREAATSVSIKGDIEIHLDQLKATSNFDNKVSLKKDNWVHDENLNEGMIDLKNETDICTTTNDVAIPIDVNTHFQKSWEIRAFFTTLIIAFQTTVLTSPFVASYWVEVLSNTPLTLQVRIILLFPFLINSLSNPFIYAWRIPEIREEFRRLFRINT